MKFKKSNHHHDSMFGNIEPLYFNPEARPGFGKALSKAYAEWSEQNDGHSREEGQAKYKELAKELESKFPMWKDLT